MTRQEEQRDPEEEAEFDRAFEKMMAESMESRKFERKPMFDVPLPMRRAVRESRDAGDDSPGEGATTPPNTMAFSLMTKKGNRQQVCITCCSASFSPQLIFSDSNHRTSLGLKLCRCDEVAKTGRTRGTTAYQESRSQL